jgi:hypothetical protein
MRSIIGSNPVEFAFRDSNSTRVQIILKARTPSVAGTARRVARADIFIFAGMP